MNSASIIRETKRHSFRFFIENVSKTHVNTKSHFFLHQNTQPKKVKSEARIQKPISQSQSSTTKSQIRNLIIRTNIYMHTRIHTCNAEYINRGGSATIKIGKF